MAEAEAIPLFLTANGLPRHRIRSINPEQWPLLLADPSRDSMAA
jgi:hypothetical protein